MKRKKYLLGSILCLLLVCCMEDELYTNKKQQSSKELIRGQNKELTISAAANWYVNHEKPVTRMGITQDNLLGIMVAPSWNHAKEWKKGKYEVVEASLRSNTNVIFYDQDTYNQKDRLNKNDKKRIMNVGRTVILKNLETEEIISFNMVIIGSQDYILHQDGLSNNSYLYREPQFDGMVLYFSLDGNFVNGWKYEKGKITKSLSPALNYTATTSDSLSSATTRSGSNCYETTYPFIYYYCPPSTRSLDDDWDPDWGPVWGDTEFGLDPEPDGNANGGSLGDINISAPECYPITVDVPYTVCDDEGGSSGGGYIGGNNTPITPSKPKYPNIIRIIQDTTKLSAEQLDKAISQMEKKMCYAKKILDYLNSQSFMFNSVYIDPNLAMGGANAANSIKGEIINLVFGENDNITYGTFAHELTHLFQEYLGETPKTEKGLMEYERALIDDIMYYAQAHGKETLGDRWIEKGVRSPFVYGERPWDKSNLEQWKKDNEEWEKKQAKYLKWLSELTKSGVPSSISNNDFKEWISLFSNHNRPYRPERGYNYDVDYTPKALAKVLELASSCY